MFGNGSPRCDATSRKSRTAAHLAPGGAVLSSSARSAARARIGASIDAVAETRDPRALSEHGPDGLCRTASVAHRRQKGANLVRTATVQRSADHRKAGLYHQVRVGPGARRHTSRQRRCGQLVVGQQDHGGVEDSQLLSGRPAGGELAPKTGRHGVAPAGPTPQGQRDTGPPSGEARRQHLDKSRNK